MYTIQGTLDRDMHILLVHLAVGSSIFRVAEARSVVTPPSVATVIRARLHTAVIPPPACLAPARSVKAQPIVTAVAQAHRYRAIGATEPRATHACTILAEAISRTIILAHLD